MNIGLFRKELNIDARMARTFVIRTLFVAVIFFLVWFTWFDVDGRSQSEGASLGRGIFVQILGLEFVLLLVLIPIISVPAFIAEKRSRSLDMLLITRLSPRDIVLKKFFAKSLIVATLILAGLPLTALTMVYGGVSPQQVIASFLIVATSSFAAVALSVKVSLESERLERAVLRTYARMPALFLAPLLLFLLLTPLFLFTPNVSLIIMMIPPLALRYVLTEGTALFIASGMLSVAYALIATIWLLRKSILEFSLYAKTLEQNSPDPALSVFAPPTGGMNIIRREGKRIFRVTDPVEMLENIRGIKGIVSYLVIVILAGFALAFSASFFTGGAVRPDPADKTALLLASPVRWSFLFFALLASATAISSLREHRALDLVVMTRVSPAALVFGKLWAIFRLIGPLYVAYAILWLIGRGAPHELLFTLLQGGFLAAATLVISACCRTNARAFLFTMLFFIGSLVLPGWYFNIAAGHSFWMLPCNYPPIVVAPLLLLSLFLAPRLINRVVGTS